MWVISSLFKGNSSILVIYLLIIVASFIYFYQHDTTSTLLTSHIRQETRYPETISSQTTKQTSPFSPRNTQKQFELTLWSSDLHISPIADIKHILAPFGVKIIDKSLSGHCHLTNTCATDLQVIDKTNAIELNPCPNQLIRQFYKYYAQDPLFKQIDGFLCLHATSLCELFMAFNKPLIVITSTRYEIGRYGYHAWQRWNENLRLIQQKTMNTIAANNIYDLEYMKYFTGLSTIQYMPNYCGYVNTTYHPTRSEILIAPSRGINSYIYLQFQMAISKYHQTLGQQHKHQWSFKSIRKLYPIHYEYSDLSQHPAIVFLPYQISIMSMFEFYRMNIPIFVPSITLLASWHVKYNVLNERSWQTILTAIPSKGSILPRHINSTSKFLSDPNDEYSLQAIEEWISLSDFYQWPYIIQFNSWKELFQQLHSLDLLKISQQMQTYNQEIITKIQTNWMNILIKIQHEKEQRIQSNTWNNYPENVQDALEQAYQIKLSHCEEQYPIT